MRRTQDITILRRAGLVVIRIVRVGCEGIHPIIDGRRRYWQRSNLHDRARSGRSALSHSIGAASLTHSPSSVYGFYHKTIFSTLLKPACSWQCFTRVLDGYGRWGWRWRCWCRPGWRWGCRGPLNRWHEGRRPRVVRGWKLWWKDVVWNTNAFTRIRICAVHTMQIGQPRVPTGQTVGLLQRKDSDASCFESPDIAARWREERLLGEQLTQAAAACGDMWQEPAGLARRGAFQSSARTPSVATAGLFGDAIAAICHLDRCLGRLQRGLIDHRAAVATYVLASKWALPSRRWRWRWR